MSRLNIETAVGIFMVAGFLCFAWLSVRLGDVNLLGESFYDLKASFGSVSGLKEGASVEIAGVKVGKVKNIILTPERYDAVVTLAIEKDVKITEDSIASIRTAGIIGDRYVDISPGGSDSMLAAGGVIEETESAINLESLISKYMFEK